MQPVLLCIIVDEVTLGCMRQAAHLILLGVPLLVFGWREKCNFDYRHLYLEPNSSLLNFVGELAKDPFKLYFQSSLGLHPGLVFLLGKLLWHL